MTLDHSSLMTLDHSSPVSAGDFRPVAIHKLMGFASFAKTLGGRFLTIHSSSALLPGLELATFLS